MFRLLSLRRLGSALALGGLSSRAFAEQPDDYVAALAKSRVLSPLPPPPPPTVEDPADPALALDAARINFAALAVRMRRLARGAADAALDGESDDDDEDDDNGDGDDGNHKDAGGAGGGAAPPARSAPAVTAEAAAYLVRQSQRAPLVRAMRAADVASIDRELCLIVRTRGCHPAVARAALRSAEAAAAADRGGVTFYAVTDETPSAVCALVRSALHCDAAGAGAPFGGSGGSEGAEPFIAVFDRAGASRAKYVLPNATASAVSAAAVSVSGTAAAAIRAVADAEEENLPASMPAAARERMLAALSPEAGTAVFEIGAGVFAAASPPPPVLPLPLSPAAQAQLAAVPYPSALARHVARVLRGGLAPTLLGRPRPAGDEHPVHPALTEVVGASWREIVLGDGAGTRAGLDVSPKRDVVLEAFLTGCPMCLCLAPRVRMLATLAAAHFPHVRVAAMNVDENDRPLEWMPGPAFPTIQLFNGGGGVALAGGAAAGGSTAGSAAAGGPLVGEVLTLAAAHNFSRLLGPRCAAPAADAAAAASARVPAALAAVAAAGARTTLTGTPPCVPAVDFAHPSAPGKMAMPSVTELLYWVAANCSRPFDPAAVAVSPGEVLGSAQRFADILPPRAPGGADIEGERGIDAGPSLLTLARDMDAEATVLEAAVFDLFYFEHMAEAAAKAVGVGDGGGGGGGADSGGIGGGAFEHGGAAGSAASTGSHL